MAKSNRQYWIERAQHRELISYTNGLDVTAFLVKEYKKCAARIRKDISDFYTRYANDYGLTYEQAVREMSRPEFQEWHGTVEDYIKEIRREENPVLRERLMREYDARSYNSRISRLDGLCGNIQMNVDRLYSRAVNQLTGFLGEEFKGSYYRTMYDLQTVNGFSSNFSTINAELVEKTLAYPWSGANFSDRLWKNKNALIDTIRETLTQGMIRGDSIRDMTRDIAEKLGSSLKNAERVVRTETSHIHNTAEIEAYKAGGYEQYEFMASLGERTCPTCGGMDGKRFKLSDKADGLNFPPLHPNCRCTTIAFDPDDDLEDMKSGELDYEQWYKKYVEGREQPKLESKGGAAVEVPKQPVPSIPTGEKKTVDQTLTTARDSGIIDVDDNMQRFKEKLNNGLVNTTIDKRNQKNHTLSAAWLNSVKQAFNAIASGKSVTPKSRLFKQYDPQLLADAYCGKGRLEYRVGSNNFDEFVELPFYVGVTFEKSTRKYVKTKVLQIKYSDKGVHLFPTKEMRK